MNRLATNHDSSPTHAVVLTPIGRGAVAVIPLSGPQAMEAVDAHFVAANGKPLAAQPIDAIRFGHWGNQNGEEVVVCRRQDSQSPIPNPQSPIVEIHCHGGHAAQSVIMADLRASGCTPLDWQEWLVRTARDPIAAEAQIALADAPTERTAAILLDQYHGALTRAIQSILALLDGGYLREATREVVKLLARAELGRHLTEPWRVVLAGPPNVGKSSLINAMLGYTRSIVFEQPGTTRDVVTERTAISGWPVELADTAGLRTSDDALEAVGIELATNTLVQADLVIFVRDATHPQVAATESLLTAKRLLRVRNKIDLVPDIRPDPNVIDTSVVTGSGIETVLDAVAQTLAPDPPEPGVAVPFSQPQRAALEQARAALAANDGRTARRHLQALLAPTMLI